MWPELSRRLAGRTVVLEPVSAAHEDGLFAAAQESDWTWMFLDAGSDRAVFDLYFADMRRNTVAGTEVGEWPAVRANLERRLGR